jgi:hypothetical protein
LGTVVINGFHNCPSSASSFEQDRLKQLKSDPATHFKMPAPNYGALGMTFTVMRGMQAVCLISIIGMTSNFIAEMNAADNAPPSVLVGTLGVVSTLQHQAIPKYL